MAVYQKEYTKEISFPLGGIGTGSIGLGGNGRLMDWEIFNRPNKGSLNGYTHMAVRAETKDGVCTRVLHGDLDKDYMGQHMKTTFIGFGYGPARDTMSGFPHFQDWEFEGTFPIAKLRFRNNDFPGEVMLTAFNPFIPLKEDDSSIPAAFFEITFQNPTDEAITYTAAFSMQNPFEQSLNQAVRTGNYTGIHLTQTKFQESEIGYGDLFLGTDCPDAAYQEYWYRGMWQDSLTRYWRQFSEGGPWENRHYDTPGRVDTGTLTGTVTLSPGESRKVRFLLSWNFPNQCNDWNPMKDQAGHDVTWKNYYAVLFRDAKASALYGLENWDSLYRQTARFTDALFDMTLPEQVIDAASANLSTLKSPVALRLENGAFYGWEGLHEEKGSCEGTCAHVWNYAYAMPFLFPRLERSIRELEFRYSTDQNGRMQFRMNLPLGREMFTHRACVDGQMGAVIKTYREWKICGDDAWLKARWPDVKKVLEYAWSPQNQDRWDANKDGVLEGRQHHTLDMELFGPSSWLEGFYIAALKSAAEMADYLGEGQRAQAYRDLAEKGQRWMEKELFNGQYYIQKIDLKDKEQLVPYEGAVEQYWNEETGEIKYQIGQGSSIDQMCAQWHANILGLGDVYQPSHKAKALGALYRNNFKKTMRDICNPWRIFCMDDESGAIICDFPEGTQMPQMPVPYCTETMHGFEYQLAGLLISEGMRQEGETIVKSVRDRYDGKKRNPWNEIECGSNYARSMASFALVAIYSGFLFDLPHKRIGFDPIMEEESFRGFWCVGSGWGTVTVEQNRMEIAILDGSLRLQELVLPFAKGVQAAEFDGVRGAFRPVENGIAFEERELCQKILVVFERKR